MTFEEFKASRIEGLQNLYYAGGSLCIYWMRGYTDEYSVILGNQQPSGTLEFCEKLLFDDYGYEYDVPAPGEFEPEPMVAGWGTESGMSKLLQDYCTFHGLPLASADELALDAPTYEHRRWFRLFSSIWEDLE